MSIFSFLNKKSTAICFGILTLIMFFTPLNAFAQGAGNLDTGPFQEFLTRAATLFMQTRNALFVVAAFAFIKYAWTAIQEGKIETDKIFWLIVGLVILGAAGWIVSYLANPADGGDAVIGSFSDLDDVPWGN